MMIYNCPFSIWKGNTILRCTCPSESNCESDLEVTWLNVSSSWWLIYHFINLLWKLFFLWLSSGQTTDCTAVLFLHNKLKSFQLIPNSSQRLPYKVMIWHRRLPYISSAILKWAASSGFHPRTAQVPHWNWASLCRLTLYFSLLGWAPGLCC